mgnify:CR=1 FL=1
MVKDDNNSPSAQGTLAQSSVVVAVGDVIHGKYKVERVIGEGGMGLVVAAKHLTLDRSVALKVLNQKSQESPEALERFTREARAAARIQSEHVGRVLDVDSMPGGAPFIVMELLEGNDLAEEVRQHQRVPVDRAVTFLLQACEAIAEAHASGIVHRDLKPANLFLSKSASGNVSVKVLDFGISKITRAAEGSITANKALTNPTSMLGSPLYMSPEQMKASTEVDARTDIWSLGVILYELLSGRSPFDANTIPMICAAVLSQNPPSIASVLLANGIVTEAIPEGIERIVVRCLQKDPEKRYRDIAHLARALSAFAPEQGKITIERVSKLKDEQGMPAASPASMFPPSSPREGSLTITSWGARPVPSPARRFLPLAVVGVVVAAIGIAALVMVLGKAEVPVTVANDPASLVAVTQTSIASAPAPASATPPSPSASAPSASAELVISASAPSASASVSALTTVRAPVGGWKKPAEKGRTTGFGGRE